MRNKAWATHGTRLTAHGGGARGTGGALDGSSTAPLYVRRLLSSSIVDIHASQIGS